MIERAHWMRNLILHPTSTHTAYFLRTPLPPKKKYLKKRDDDIIITFFRYFFFLGWRGPSKVCSVGTRWMWNQIPHPTSSPDQNLIKSTIRYVENTNKKIVFFNDKYVNLTIMVDLFYWNSIGSWIPTHKNLFWHVFL